eukprot:CAMPEP_0185724368 /NCGR_PEP_ID=MMETSP1171-20130828/875_1 /TAXON_ID=374046 /ORGANISM="Helicotheca tamensis, Strain CCMP826" /LENGTH=522 /DNA_ID=CAMNT_0028392203 /DNA_START=62 /DNA_END=1630 /DNA_ORIENTATION=+
MMVHPSARSIRKTILLALGTAFTTTTTLPSSSQCIVSAFGIARNNNALHIKTNLHNKQKHFFSSSSTTTATILFSNNDTPATLPSFETKEDYIKYLSSPVSDLPKGFEIGTGAGKFIPVEAPMMGELPIRATVIHLKDGPTDNWAAVFTKNKCPGSPILVGRKRLSSNTPINALVINNKISNVCSGGDGVANAEHVCKAVADSLSLSHGMESVLPCSTGVIGWRLPAKELAEDVVPKAIESMQSASAMGAAEAIMTTDRYPKLRSKTLSNGARIVGIAKGAGMIEPNMATMLSYIMTDASIDKKTLQSYLSEVVDQSFNSISVDGSESTSDTVVLISSNQVPTDITEEFKDALYEISQGLAADIVRNGEGTGHVMRIQIANFPGSDKDARNLGRFIANNALFKCAISGNDPNIGRLAGAIGSFMGRFNDGECSDATEKMTLTLGGRVIFTDGKFKLEGDAVERELSDHMKDAQLGEVDEFPKHQRFVEIGVNFAEGEGEGSAIVLGSDLTAEYVSVNADYRS